MNLKGYILFPILMTILGGCSGNYQSIYRYKPLDKNRSSITTIDAKQRAIIADNRGSGSLKFCTEPSPDVFSVLAQAISGSGTFGQRADPMAIEATLSAAFSSSEQGSTIPRTQTINMLRELMYRTCERWLNNELSSDEMPIQSARDQRLMVSILAIEQLTGAVTTKSVVIGSASNTSTDTSGSDAAVRIDDAFKVLTAKTAGQQARQKEFDEVIRGTNLCEAIAKKVENDETLDEAQTRANEKCETAKTALSQANLERANAAAHHHSLIDAIRAGGISATVESTVDSHQSDGGIEQADTSDIKSVANIVRDIVRLNFDQDEFLLFCIKVLKDTENNIKEACVNHVKSSIERSAAENERDAAHFKQEAAQYLAAAASMETHVQRLFESFWQRIKSDDRENIADEQTLSSVLDQVVISADAKSCFKAAGLIKSKIRECFTDINKVSPYLQRKLANAGD